MPPPEGERIAQLCRAIYENMRERVYAGAARRGFDDLRPAHSGVLRHIDAAGSRVVDLADRAGMTKQSMAYLVDALTESGYLTTAADPHDGRAKRVLLTRRGSKAMATLLALSAQFEQRLAERLGVGKMTRLRALLEEVADALESSGLRDAP